MATGRQPIKAELAQGHRLGRYTIDEPVGQGGMGTVYRAFDKTTNRNVAVKILAPGISDALRERFLAECEAQAKIRHPHVMPVYDQAWLTDTRPYFTMELLYDPVTLTEIVEWTADGSLSKRYPGIRHWADPVKLIRDVILPISDGIAVSNGEYRIQHRDLKPDNILIDTRTRRPYVIDYGICRDIDGVQAETKIVGTPRFLSPEQAHGRVDARTDVWGLGAIIHYALTGRPPLRGSSQFTRPQVEERITQLLAAEKKADTDGRTAEARGYKARREQFEADDFRTLEDLYGDARKGNYLPLPDGVSSSLRAIVRKAMSPDPADRYETAQAYAEDLGRWVRGGTVQALAETDARAAAVDATRRAVQRNLPRVVGVAVALVLGVLVGRAAFKEPPSRPDFREGDIQTALRALSDEARGVAERESLDDIDAYSAHVAWTHIQDQVRNLRARLPAINPNRRAAVEAQIASFEAQVAAAPLDLGAAEGWRIVDLLKEDAKPRAYGGVEKTTLEPGMYQLRRAGDPQLFVPLHVPFPYREPGEAAAPIKPELPQLAAKPPPGMTWVPLPETDGGPGGLLVARRLVTCEQYGEFLDDIPASERKDRIPPKGFHQGDPNDSSRWLAKAEFQDKPVAGLDAADIAAYVAWRSKAYGVAYRLLTDGEWQLAAGASLLDKPGATALFPLLRKAYRTKPVRVSPYGVSVRRSVRGYGELVRSSEGALIVKGDNTTKPWLPLLSALARSTPYEPNADADYGFRLCVEAQ